MPISTRGSPAGFLNLESVRSDRGTQRSQNAATIDTTAFWLSEADRCSIPSLNIASMTKGNMKVAVAHDVLLCIAGSMQPVRCASSRRTRTAPKRDTLDLTRFRGHLND